MIGEITGDSMVFQTMLSGQPDMVTNQYLQQQYQQNLANYSPASREFFTNTTGSVFNGMDFNEINRLSKALYRNQDVGWVSNNVDTYTDIAEFQHASPVMIGWIMVEPTVRQMYHNQQLAGYDEFYVDPHPTQRGEDYVKYQQVMQGLVHEDTNGEMVSIEWFNDQIEQVETLDLVDQSRILNTWRALRAHLDYGIDDPTSRFNAKL